MKLSIVPFLFITTAALAQDYVIVGNDTLTNGVIRRFGNRKLSVVGDSVAQFPMDQVVEYSQRFTVRRAFMVAGKRQMYKQIASGKVTLFKRHRSYILKSNGRLIELHKNDFRANLASVLTCTGKPESISNVLFSRISLQGVVEASNNGSCNFDRLAYRKFGVMAGYNVMSFRASAAQSIHSKASARTYSVGMFFEAPLFASAPWFYGSAEVLFITPYQAEFNFYETLQATRMTAKMSSAMAAPGVKLITKKGSVRPYVKFAPTISYTQFDSPRGVLKNGTDQVVTYVHPDRYLQVGLSTAAGMQFQVGQRKNVHVELRYMAVAPDHETQFEISSKSTVAAVGFSL